MSETNIIRFSQMKNETDVYDTAMLITKLSDEMASNGKPYVAMMLSDGEQTHKVNVWETEISTLSDQGIVEESIVAISLKKRGNFFNLVPDNSGQLIRLNMDPSITIDNFIKSAPIDRQSFFDVVINTLNDVERHFGNKEAQYAPLTTLAKNILMRYKEEFIFSSAAVTMHHNYVGGLLYHSGRMAFSAFVLSTMVYKKTVDPILLVAGAVLHDIGKLKAYDTTIFGEASVTLEGRLLDHAVLGIMLIEEELEEGDTREQFDPVQIDLLKHLIASHHGSLEHGAIVTPAIPEAMMLHQLDMMDSRMDMFEEAYVSQESGTLSEKRVYGLDNSFIFKK